MKRQTWQPEVLLALLLLAIVVPFLANAQPDATLERVLSQLDKTASNFHSTEANFVWDQYQKVVDETESQKGKIYFRRTGGEIQMAADITLPEPKYVLFTDSKIEWYQPRIDQVTVYNTRNRSEVETFLVLGFGGGGHELLKSFEVKHLGTEKLGNAETVKIELTPKSQKVRNNIDHIVLWIDPDRGVSVQQQLFEPSGDYRLAKYSDIRINEKISDAVFKLKTTSKTKTVSTQG
jgi:outer membrane lipoprotein-sorting protein